MGSNKYLRPDFYFLHSPPNDNGCEQKLSPCQLHVFFLENVNEPKQVVDHVLQAFVKLQLRTSKCIFNDCVLLLRRKPFSMSKREKDGHVDSLN